jgi:hypothetical protein
MMQIKLVGVKPKGLLIMLLTALSCFTGFSQDAKSGQLPDILRLNNGTTIHSAHQWITKRRPEILGIFTQQMYGQSPARPEKMTFQVVDNDCKALGGIATRKQIRVLFNGDPDGPYMEILLYLPNHVKHPVSLFVGYNFAGNQSINNDTAVHITRSWMSNKTKGVIDNHATEATRGIASGAWPVETILKRGYGLATMYAGDIDPDFDDGFKNGIQALYPELEKNDANFSTMAAWAWGLSRALDYFETDKTINSKKIIVYGTSRMGKAAIWAGATDQRFAMVISNESGAGGAKLFHHLKGENIAQICKVFPHWFCRNFGQYTGKDSILPFDQHMVLALIAPRPLYVASAQGSNLTDSYGEFLSAKYADPVYRLFHNKGLPLKEMPDVDHAVFGQIGYHNRTGKHDILPYDWEQFLHFADMHLNR